MSVLGTGDYIYRVVKDWAKLPDGWALSDVASVAVDSKDRLYAFNRGAHPMIVFDRDGNFLTSWGEGLFAARMACRSTPMTICTAPMMAIIRCANAPPRARCC